MSTPDSTPASPERRTRWLMVPPPLLFVLSFAAGLQAGRLVALGVAPPAFAAAARAAGIAFILLAVLLLVPAPALFVLHRTTIIPHAQAQRLVTNGPYHFTRNPMYLGLVLAYLGVAGVMNVAWPLLFLLLPLAVLHTKIIPFEEAGLERRFGAQYRAYRARVRRWI